MRDEGGSHVRLDLVTAPVGIIASVMVDRQKLLRLAQVLLEAGLRPGDAAGAQERPEEAGGYDSPENGSGHSAAIGGANEAG